MNLKEINQYRPILLRQVVLITAIWRAEIENLHGRALIFREITRLNILRSVRAGQWMDAEQGDFRDDLEDKAVITKRQSREGHIHVRERNNKSTTLSLRPRFMQRKHEDFIRYVRAQR